MEIGFFTSGYLHLSLEDAFRDAKRFGYDYVEVSGFRPHAYAPDLVKNGAAEIRALSKKYGMDVRGYAPEINGYPYNFMCGDEDMRRDSVDFFKVCIDAAKIMGAQFTLISAGHAGWYITREEMWKRLVDTVGELSEYSEKAGLKLVLEPLAPAETNVLNNAIDLAAVIKEVDSPALVGMCDVVPPFLIGEAIMSYFRNLGDKMYHMHLIDCDGSSEDHVVPGDGIMPLGELIGELQAIDFKGTATIELVTKYINEPTLYAKRAIDVVRSFMQ